MTVLHIALMKVLVVNIEGQREFWEMCWNERDEVEVHIPPVTEGPRWDEAGWLEWRGNVRASPPPNTAAATVTIPFVVFISWETWSLSALDRDSRSATSDNYHQGLT